MNPKTCTNISLKKKFTIHFLKALKKINTQKRPLRTQRYNRVKVAADSTMASVVGSRRAWSRAMLFNIRCRRMANRVPVVRARRMRRPRGGSDQTDQLRRLVPGGEAMDVYSLLDETAHYIKCLATQVKVMRNIVDYCST